MQTNAKETDTNNKEYLLYIHEYKCAVFYMLSILYNMQSLTNPRQKLEQPCLYMRSLSICASGVSVCVCVHEYIPLIQQMGRWLYAQKGWFHFTYP